jgi:uncharacterized membrane protein
MKQERHADVLAQGIKYLLGLGALAGVLVVLAYTNKFAHGHWFELSGEREVWGTFGDYIGGVLNPIFSFLAFIGVLLTVLLQAKQLDIARDQAHFEELQRVLASLSNQIDSMLNQMPTYYAAKEFVRGDVAPLTLFNHISAFGTDLLRPSAQRSFENTVNEHGVKGLRNDISVSVDAVALEFHSLAWALQNYGEKGGSATVVEFYKFRYGAIVTWLDVMGAINATSRVRLVFDIEMLKRSLTPDGGVA